MDKGLVDILFSEINVNKTSGIEGIRCDILKSALRFLLEPMTWLYQLAFDTGIFPDSWKIARVNPIPKNGNLKLITNWRPISLLTTPSKIAERIMHIHLMGVLDDCDFLSDKQFGYRPERGTGDAIFGFLSDIYLNRDRGHLTGACFVDLRKAFDCVSHPYLIETLGKLGLHDKVLNWLMSYLTGRSQYTKVGSLRSTVSSVEYGVPQGSVLGPLLFIVYINDICNRLGGCKFYLYADDLVVYASANRIDLIQARLQSAINEISAWCNEKRLTINTDKTKVTWFGSTSKLSRVQNLEFYLNGDVIETVDCYSYLGLKIDSALSFEPALLELNNKVNHKLFRLSKLRNNMTENCSVKIYRAMVLSLFDYACFTHDSANEGLLKKLDRLQKRGLKICYRNRDWSEDDLYANSMLPRLPRRRQELILTYMYKLSKSTDWIDLRQGRSGLRSEDKIKFKMPRIRNSGYKRSPLYRGIALWDNLGSWFHNSKDKLTFKQRIRSIEDLNLPTPNPDLDNSTG